MSTNFSIKRQIFVFFYWDWLCLLEGNKIHCGGRRDHKNSLCSEEKISLEFYSLQTFRVVLMVGILQSNWWNELLKIFFYTILVGISSYFFSPRGRYVPPGYIPSSNRPVRAPRLHTLSQQTGTCPRASPSPTDRYQQLRGPPVPQQTGTSPQATHPLPTDRYVPPG
jgi:hypothetical protein